MFPGILFCTQAVAVDELYLCGIVKEVNTIDALVTIDVASKSCGGLQKFKLSAATKGRTSFTVGNRKCFFINSNSCKAGYLYTITKIEPE